MKTPLLTMGLAVASVMTLAGSEPGLRPRPSLADYPSKAEGSTMEVGAAILSPDTVRKLFATDLNRAYVVVEVALYPKPGQTIDVSARDFLLRVAGSSALLRAASPASIAGNLNGRSNRPSRDRDITVVPTASVGYESGGYDPVTGRRRSGWVTSSGVGVGVSPPGGSTPPPSDRDRSVMESELSDQTIPEGPASRPVAGYLYFPLPERKKATTFDLELDSSGVKLQIPLFVEKR